MGAERVDVVIAGSTPAANVRTSGSMTGPANTVLADVWGMHHSDMGIGWWMVTMLGMVVFWGAVIALVVWLVRGDTGGRRNASSDAPEETLRQRLADRSISVEEYEQRRTALEGSAPAVGDQAATGTA